VAQPVETELRSTWFNLMERAFMSAPARQTRNVDSISDDPERLLDVGEAAALLHVKAKTLYAWVSRNKIPYRKICSLVRFHRGELIEWAKGQQQNTSKATPKPLSMIK
jgi:excisionase family DNA binding protein